MYTQCLYNLIYSKIECSDISNEVFTIQTDLLHQPGVQERTGNKENIKK